MKRMLPACLLLLSFIANAQNDIIATGKILDAATGKGIKAKIFYKSIPTGSITGRFMDSVFSFTIFGSSKYQIEASADGYTSGIAIVDPKDIDANHQVVRDVLLVRKGETIRLDHLIFEQGKGTITTTSFSSLDEVVAMMKERQTMVIQLEGHTDNQGNAKANMELSQNRVDNVKKYLVSKGISKDRVKTKAFGGTQPLQSSGSPERNRRVEMRILKD